MITNIINALEKRIGFSGVVGWGLSIWFWTSNPELWSDNLHTFTFKYIIFVILIGYLFAYVLRKIFPDTYKKKDTGKWKLFTLVQSNEEPPAGMSLVYDRYYLIVSTFGGLGLYIIFCIFAAFFPESFLSLIDNSWFFVNILQ